MVSTTCTALDCNFFFNQLVLQKRLNELCNSCVVSCQDHSGTAPAARAQARLLDPSPHPFPWGISHSFGPGQAEDELPVRSPLSPSACCLIALVLKMHSLHTVNLHKIIFTSFYSPKSFGSQEVPLALERSHIQESSQNPFTVYIPGYTWPNASQKCAKNKHMQIWSNIVAFILETTLWK